MAAKNMNDVAPIKPLFEGHEKIEKKDLFKKDERVSQEIVVLAYSKMTSEDGDYGVMAFRSGEKLLSCTVNGMMLERLEDVASRIGLTESRSDGKEKYFSEPISTKIKMVESKRNNKDYYTFE